jgi:pyruvate dehydrogenase E1 component alpha subunit
MKSLFKNIFKNRIDQLILNELMKKKVFNPVHLALGHEGVSEIINNFINLNDELILTHRNIAFNLARERNLKRIISELSYKTGGISLGEMGSMNMINKKKNINYSSSILGNNFSVGLGVSLANSKLSSKSSLTVVVTGDGAIEEGSFYETLILGNLLEVPLVILVINDNFAMASKILQRRKLINLKKIADSMGLRYLNLNQSHVLKKIKNIEAILLHSKKKNKLSIIEINIKTFNGHCGPSPGWPEDPNKIYIDNGLIIKNNNDDILYLLKKKLGKIIFNKYEKIYLEYAKKILKFY